MNFPRGKKYTLLDLARKNRESRSSKNKKMFKDGVNQRANIKQRQVTDMIATVANCPVAIEEPDLCKKILTFEGFPCIDILHLSYFTKNNLFSRIFELIIESYFYSSLNGNIDEDISIDISYTGKFKTSGVVFTALSKNETTLQLVEQLNGIELITKRITHLEALDLKIEFSALTNEWSIGFATGKGSTVWALFPPMLMLVPFKENDAIKLLELYQLIIHEIKEFEQKI